MTDIWFTSDTHYGHNNILAYCNRPFADVVEHDNALMGNFNKLVKRNDIVYHLGDFCLGPPWLANKIYHSLNGRINLIVGNHDRLKNYRGLFETVQNVHMLKLGKEMFWLSHYAHARWPHAHYGAYHLFGHSHGGFKGLGKSMDVGVDTNKYAPYHIDDVRRLLKNLKPVEHHRED